MRVGISRLRKSLLEALLLIFIGGGLILLTPRQLASANLTSVDDTLETSRLSVHGKNAVNLTAGSTVIQMATSGVPSKSTVNIFPGDTLIYSTTSNSYTVDSIVDDDQFSVGVGLSAADCDADDVFYIKRTATHTVDMTTASAYANGSIRVRIKADGTTPNDGNPDDEGFDFNSITGSSVTCPSDVANFYDFVAPTATASGGTGCPAGYHCFECRQPNLWKILSLEAARS